jgi:phenylacetate-CoA ligase
MVLLVEQEAGVSPDALQDRIARNFKTRIGILIDVKTVPIGELPRSEKKSKRVFDERDI